MSSGLRERKKAETLAALQDAALRLADRHGVDKVSVEAIAEAAGVSPRTFFNYFATKEDAVIGKSPTDPSPLLERLRARPADEAPLEALRQALQESLQGLVEDRERWALRRRLVQRHPGLAARNAARLAEMEQDLVEEIGRRTGIDPGRHPYPGTVVSAAMNGARVALSIWHDHGDEAELSTLIDQAFASLATGLVPPP
ncbi:MAG TPA: TetR family transcriptional regulator [Acidimicrobiales bacterium]